MVLGLICLIIVVILILCHEIGKLSFTEVVLLSWTFSTFYIGGLTINPFFIIGLMYGFLELFYIIQKKRIIPFEAWIIISMPFLTSILFWISLLFGIVEYEILSSPEIFINPFYFFIKFYLPLLLVGHRVYRLTDLDSLNDLFKFFERIVLFSACVGIFQIVVFLFVQNEFFIEIIGLKLRYHYRFGEVNLIRINAFLYEPKELAVLMSLGTIHFFNKSKRYQWMLCLLVGILTLSNSFAGILLLAIVYWIIRKFIKNYSMRPVVVFFAFFSIFFFTQSVILSIDKGRMSREYPIFYEFVLKRALVRYDENNPFVGKMFFGFPLQADLEGPIMSYFEEEPQLFLTGFGAGNSTFIPNKYFYGTWAFAKRETGARRWNVNMGWFFWIFQYGIVLFGFIYYYSFRTKSVNPNLNEILALLFSIFILARVEIFIVIILAMIMAERKSEKNEFKL